MLCDPHAVLAVPASELVARRNLDDARGAPHAHVEHDQLANHVHDAHIALCGFYKHIEHVHQVVFGLGVGFNFHLRLALVGVEREWTEHEPCMCRHAHQIRVCERGRLGHDLPQYLLLLLRELHVRGSGTDAPAEDRFRDCLAAFPRRRTTSARARAHTCTRARTRTHAWIDVIQIAWHDVIHPLVRCRFQECKVKVVPHDNVAGQNGLVYTRLIHREHVRIRGKGELHALPLNGEVVLPRGAHPFFDTRKGVVVRLARTAGVLKQLVARHRGQPRAHDVHHERLEGVGGGLFELRHR